MHIRNMTVVIDKYPTCVIDTRSRLLAALQAIQMNEVWWRSYQVDILYDWCAYIDKLSGEPSLAA